MLSDGLVRVCGVLWRPADGGQGLVVIGRQNSIVRRQAQQSMHDDDVPRRDPAKATANPGTWTR